MFNLIVKELKEHAPFTIFGALTGIVIILIFKNMPPNLSHTIFYTLHPIHVVLSALVTSSVYKVYKSGKIRIYSMVLIGYLGSVGIATLSDSIIPYLGEIFLQMPNRGVHLGFIEKWWLVNPLALLGIAIAYFSPSTKFPHSGHVLLSTWASLFHIIMATGNSMSWVSYLIILLFLFIAVWIPCCLSDIIFPLMFVGKRGEEGHTHD